MVLLYMVTFTINIPPMLAYIYHTWILWDMIGKSPKIMDESGKCLESCQTKTQMMD